jgi:very-short-patch-repair endonuclease
MKTRWKGSGNPFYGKLLTIQHKLKISKVNSDRCFSDEHKKRIGEANHRRIYTQDMRNRISERAIKRIQNNTTQFSNTVPEKKIKDFLILNNLIENKDYIHQYYVKEISNKYLADFYIPKIKTIIEVDGDYYHANDRSVNKELNDRQKKQVNKDKIRTIEMRNSGFIVLRFWEHNIKNNFNLIQTNLLKLLSIGGY